MAVTPESRLCDVCKQSKSSSQFYKSKNACISCYMKEKIREKKQKKEKEELANEEHDQVIRKLVKTVDEHGDIINETSEVIKLMKKKNKEKEDLDKKRDRDMEKLGRTIDKHLKIAEDVNEMVHDIKTERKRNKLKIREMEKELEDVKKKLVETDKKMDVFEKFTKGFELASNWKSRR
jgi:hypothetical protein